jgi:hypothetical protein
MNAMQKETCRNRFWSINSRWHESIYPSRFIFSLLFVRFFQPRLSGGLDAHGIRVVWNHHAGVVGGVVGFHAGAWRRFVGGWTIHRCVDEEDGLSAAFFLCGAETGDRAGCVCGPEIVCRRRKVLLASGETDSFGYLSLSALVLAVSILPWCVCMGATFPFMMAYVGNRIRQHGEFQFFVSGQCAGRDERNFFGGGGLD